MIIRIKKFKAFAKNRPAEPNPKCRSIKLHPIYTLVLKRVKYLNLGIVFIKSPLAMTKASIEPFIPKTDSKTK